MAGVVRRIKLGSQGLEVSAQGLGCMGMSAFYGPPKPDEDMIALIHHAVATGVTFLDTSDIYGPYTNEILLGKALKGGVRDKVELATKFGISFADNKREIRGDPAYVRAAIEGSLKRLGVGSVDLYYQHRVDTRVPIEVTHSQHLDTAVAGTTRNEDEAGQITVNGDLDGNAKAFEGKPSFLEVVPVLGVVIVVFFLIVVFAFESVVLGKP